MKKMKTTKLFTAIVLLGLVLIGFTQCKKKSADSVSNVAVTLPASGAMAVDGTWTLDQVHVGFVWRLLFDNLSNTYLTGKFNNFGFSPAFSFDPANPSAAQIHFWIDMSTFNTGQPGRDGNGKCGPSYLGITYRDSAKTKVDSATIFAYYDATSITKSGDGYIAQGTLKFNRWRAISGHANGEMVSHPCTLYFTYNEFLDMDANHDGTADQYRTGFTGRLAFNRRDYVDPNSTKQYVPTPTFGTTNLSAADISGNVSAANNTMYGVYSTSVGDSCWVEVNPVFYKNH
jgi:hypothetical protein